MTESKTSLPLSKMHPLVELSHLYFQVQLDVENIKLYVYHRIQSTPLPVTKCGWYQIKAVPCDLYLVETMHHLFIYLLLLV